VVFGRGARIGTNVRSTSAEAPVCPTAELARIDEEPFRPPPRQGRVSPFSREARTHAFLPPTASTSEGEQAAGRALNGIPERSLFATTDRLRRKCPEIQAGSAGDKGPALLGELAAAAAALPCALEAPGWAALGKGAAQPKPRISDRSAAALRAYKLGAYNLWADNLAQADIRRAACCSRSACR
jgi:hypothetical protein